ncbi:hypothetical protein ABKV19_020771 [Rosa sericea]
MGSALRRVCHEIHQPIVPRKRDAGFVPNGIGSKGINLSCLSKIRSLVFVEIASFWNSKLILDIPPLPSFVAITVVGVEPRTGTISFEENMTTPIFRCL